MKAANSDGGDEWLLTRDELQGYMWRLVDEGKFTAYMVW